MGYTQVEKMKIIRLVEESDLLVTHTLKELDVARSSFYRWYRRYKEPYEGRRSRPPTSRRLWNTIPEQERARVVEIALERPKMCPGICRSIWRTGRYPIPVVNSTIR